MATFHPDPGTTRTRRQGIGALVFLGLAVALTVLPPAQQQEVAALLRSTVLRPFIATQEMVTRARVQAGEAAALRSRMDSLAAILINQTTLGEENRRLRKLLGLERRIGVDYRAASLLRPGTEGSESMFLLAVEGADSVGEGAPVIVPEGLVGVVRDVGPGGAIGMDWTHPDFRASAMTADGTTYGIVEPVPGELSREAGLILTGTPFTTDLETGTWIVTSGRGGVYPRGIPIGRIETLAESEGGWRKTYSVEPAVQLGAVTHVLVGVGETVLPVSSGVDSAAPDSVVAPDSAAAPEDFGAPDASGRPDTRAPESGAGPAGPGASTASDAAPSQGDSTEGRIPPAPIRDLRPIMLPSDSVRVDGDDGDGGGTDSGPPGPDAADGSRSPPGPSPGAR